MRVYNKQQESSGLGGGFKDSKDAQKRQQFFRQSNKVGQEVQGIVLSPRGEKAPGQAWIDVGGLPLTAQLPFEAQPGQRLLLRIESLEPEIVLKFLKQVHGAPALMQIQLYTALRHQLHSTWHKFWHNALAGKDDTTELANFALEGPNKLPNSLPGNLIELPGFKQLTAWANLADLIAKGASLKVSPGASLKEMDPANTAVGAPTTSGFMGSEKHAEFGALYEAREAQAGQSAYGNFEPATVKQAGQELQAGQTAQAEFSLALGEPFPSWLVDTGEKLVCSLHKIWSEKFISNLPKQTQKELAEINAIQLSTVKSLEHKGVRAWSQIPWASPHGSQRELLILRPDGQRLEQVFISGMWPGLGGVFINAMALNGQISCRVQVQNLLPFEQVAQIINLPGLGQIINLVAAKYNIASEALPEALPETLGGQGSLKDLEDLGDAQSYRIWKSKNRHPVKLCANFNLEDAGPDLRSSIVCLELKQQTPDTVPAILLRL